jgi:hypothetical protein
VVPQHYTGYGHLGKWVQSQRKNYKQFRKGEPASMTAEKALRLSEIGFVWDATYKIRKRAAMTTTNDDSDDERGSSPRRKIRKRNHDYYSSDEDEPAPLYHSYV